MVTEKEEQERLLSCDEVRFWHEHKKVSIQVLSELNACSRQTIQKILDGKVQSWSELDLPKHNNNPSTYVVVNSTEGRFYPSVRSCEIAEGIKHPLLLKRFSEPRCYIVNSTEGRIYPSVRAAEKSEGVNLMQRFTKGKTRTEVDGMEYHLYKFKEGSTRTILNGYEYHLYKVCY